MKNRSFLFLLIALLFSSPLIAQEKTGQVAFCVIAYKDGKFYHVGGVSVFLGNDARSRAKPVAYSSTVQRCNLDLGHDMEVKLAPGHYSYFAKSGNEKEEWRGTFTVGANMTTRVALEVDYTHYEEE